MPAELLLDGVTLREWPFACWVVDRAGEVRFSTTRARRMLELGPGDAGEDRSLRAFVAWDREALLAGKTLATACSSSRRACSNTPSGCWWPRTTPSTGSSSTRLILAEARAAGVVAPVIVAVTANAMEGDRTRCLEAGLQDYLSKPVGIGDLRRIMKAWV